MGHELTVSHDCLIFFSMLYEQVTAEKIQVLKKLNN